MTQLQAMLRVSRGSLQSGLCVAVAVAAVGCLSGYGYERHTSSVRSPSYDYQQQPRVAGGDVLGADGKTLADKLAEGPTLNSLSPGWKLSRKDGLSYDPAQRVGGNIDPPHGSESARPTAPP